jgi:hypothetical protein
MLRLFTFASCKQAASAYCRFEVLSAVSRDSEEFNLLNICMRIDRERSKPEGHKYRFYVPVSRGI